MSPENRQTDPVSALPGGQDIQSWPAYWRQLAARMQSARLQPPESPAARSTGFEAGQRHWAWGDPPQQASATLLDDAVRWQREAPQGSDQVPDIEQPIVEFLAFGAPDDTAPAPVVGDLREVIRLRDSVRWFDLLAEGQALRWQRRMNGEEAPPTRDTLVVPPPNFRRVNRSTWAWGETRGGCTAVLSGDVIVWNRSASQGHGPNQRDPHQARSKTRQSVADFIANGPADDGVPDELAWDLFNAVRDRDPKRSPKPAAEPDAPVADVEPSVVSRPPPPIAAATRPAPQRRARIEPVQTDAQALRSWDELEPLGPLLLRGLLVFGLGVALALLAALVLPASVSYLGLILPALLGFVAFLRWDAPALIVAGLIAVAASAVSQLALTYYLGQVRGTAVVIESIAEAAGHPEAARFTVTNGHAARGLSGSARPLVSGAVARSDARIYYVMPLVPPRWQRDQPVTAWVACASTAGSECLRDVDDMSDMVRVRPAEFDRYKAAVEEAEKTHGLTSVANVPVIEPITGPIEDPLVYLLAAIAAPLLGFGLWMLGVFGRRAWDRRQQAKSIAVR